MSTVPVYLEVGQKRVFAAAVDWPGWCRSGRDEASALEALAAYGPRYRKAARGARLGFKAPRDASAFVVVERLEGNAATDFGVPGVAPPGDERPLGDGELDRLQALLRASWNTFDRTAKRAVGARLRKGPRGGGRELEAIVSHVLEADRAYLSRLGGKLDRSTGGGSKDEVARLRPAFLDTLAARARGERPPPSRRRAPPWSPRYAVRRSAWHALDHAWEIEDRARPEEG